jgi:hypothetical protein
MPHPFLSLVGAQIFGPVVDRAGVIHDQVKII